MRKIFQGIGFLTASVMVGCAGQMPMIGYDAYGTPVVALVDENQYTEYLTEALSSVHESVLPALEAQEGEEKKWKLRTAVVGFALKAETGIGPFKVAIKPRVRAAFANGEKPPIP